MTAAAQALARAGEREIVKAFRSGHAVSRATALPLRKMGLNDSTPLRNMVTATIIRRAGPERYFLDEKTWASRRELGGRTMVRLLVVAGFVLAALLVYFIGR